MKDLFGGPSLNKPPGSLSLAQLREFGSRSGIRKNRSRQPQLVARSGGDRAPLSYAQERLWIVDQLGMVGPAYNSQMAFRLNGGLDAAALEHSFLCLVRRHESLRTRFESEDGVPIQVIDAPAFFTMDVQDFSGQTDVDGELARVSKVEAQRPFDLAKGPLMRVSLLRFSADVHVLVLTIHHIVTDGWSWGIIQRELAELYSAHVHGRPAALPALPVQYADYSIWQREWLQGELLERQLKFWTEQLKDAPSELELPTDRARREAASPAGSRLKFEVPAELTGELERFARSENASLFMVVLAAYQLLLARHCGQTDVVVGAPIAGRTHADTEGLIGFFVNTLALRTDLSGNPSFRQLLARVKEVTLAAYDHQDLPFEKLVTEVRPERNLARQPIFQVALSMQNYPQEQLSLPGLTWTRMPVEHASAVFDLTLHLNEERLGLSGSFVYAAELFDSTTIVRLADHLRTLLKSIATDPDCQIDQMAMLSVHEQQLLVSGFNGTDRPYAKEQSVQEVFEQCAHQAPSAVAAVCEGVVLSYGELNQKANQLARYLSSQGVRPGDFVPIAMRRSLDMVIAQLAVLKTGAAYVPLDPSLPSERQAFIIRDCAARRAIVSGGHCEVLMEGPVQLIDMAAAAALLKDFSRDDLPVRLPSATAAYVMYTSGTTGVPKGVVVPHHAINRLVVNTTYVTIHATDCVAHSSNTSFDASTFEIWGALLNGARTLIVPQDVVLEPESFAKMLLRHRVTVLWITVGLFTQYADALSSVFRQLRYLITGGDVLEPNTVKRVLARSSPGHLLNAYGPTECTTFATTHLVEGLEEHTVSLPIGKPIANTRVYILDRHLQPVPIGVTGEIYIGGDGVALGYLNRPQLTAERFVPDSFSSGANARVYKTGDLGRWRADGVIEFLGRNDRQVKLRGFRVELGEIEAHLLAHDKVGEATVITRVNISGEKYLAAYITPFGGSRLDTDELRAHLKSVLPEYMVPSAIVIMEKLPLTSNGKVDRNSLPDPATDAYVDREFDPPMGEVETTLGRIWQELLGVQRISRADSFFDLGGHSLLVLRALFKIRDVFSCALNASDIYRNPTLVELARRIGSGAEVDAVIDISREAVLNDEIVGLRGDPRIPPRCVLLTGGTGFVGRFLLAQLLKDSDATIYCLVRAASNQQAMCKLKASFDRWELWSDEYSSRIVPLRGDLRLPRLGLDERTYEMLSEEIDCIYHCGTSMNHLETYEMAKLANVASATELLRLATSKRPKLINYISTLSVFSSFTHTDHRVVDETTDTVGEMHLASNGYAASKCVADLIFSKARERDIQCNIFRLGHIWGDARLGRYDERQRDYRLIKSCLMSGKGIKDYTYELPPTSVDYVARALIFLGQGLYRTGRVFHVSSSEKRVGGLFESINRFVDKPLELLPMYDWLCEMKSMFQAGNALPIVPLIEPLFSLNEEAFGEYQRRKRTRSIRFDCARTHAELERGGIDAPVFDENLVRLCVSSMMMRDGDLHGLNHRIPVSMIDGLRSARV